jgi:hypothetical protein
MLKFRFLSVTLFLCLAAPVYAQVIFEDNFDDPAVSEGNWEIMSGVWEFKDGMLYSPNPDTQFVTMYVLESRWSKDTSSEYDEYTIELRFMKESGREFGRPLWRVIADPPPKTSGERKGFYEWNIGGWTNTRSVIRRFEPDGQAVFLADSEDQSVKLGATIEDGRWYDMKVIVQNNGKTEGYLDGQKSWEIEDNTWTDGRIGLANWYSNAFFDDYKVYGPETASVGRGNHLATFWGHIKAR